MEQKVQTGDALLALLEENGILSPEKITELRDGMQRTGQGARSLIVHMGMLSEDDLLDVIAGYMSTSVVNLPAMDVAPDVIRTIPASVARTYSVVPVEKDATSVVLAAYDLMSPQTTDELRFILTREVSFVMAREADVQSCINQFYGDDSASVNEMLKSLEADLEQVGDIMETADSQSVEQIEQFAGSAPIVRFVNLVLSQAVLGRASDIHFEPFVNEFKIRYRVDGALYEMAPPPRQLALPIISRIKVMSGLDIAERRLPQDGRIQITIAGRPIDLRVSTLPTQDDRESVVLRVLDRSTVSLELENIGMPDDVFELFSRDILKPNGILIVTGPTGSGKTTTLYSALKRINTVQVKILTAEEPVEYDIEGIVQVQIKPDIGNTFGTILRSFLRQDPDVMMVGEIRDLETAQTAIQASLTGHLVFSTLHTNDATGAITRLIDMGVEPYLLTSTLEAVIGQRLIRRICESCKRTYKPDDDVLTQLDLARDEVGERDFCYGEGCQECASTGYRGRKGIFEYLAVSEPVRLLINERKPTLLIRHKAIELGMRTLREDGIRNILNGYTTVEEVIKYT